MLSPGDHVGAYEVLGPLGAGAMGQVYRARDVKLGRIAAIKVLPDSLAQDASRRSRLEHEARALATLSHPNIAAVYGLEDAGGAPALVMELVEGRALQHEIPRKGLPLATALRYAIQIARGLEAANGAGIV